MIRDGTDTAALVDAVLLLEHGELVAFPTETVYGLGADARNPDAVAKIYAAKDRPANNPLIVHVLNAEEARKCVEGWNSRADKLASAFWPGPLTLVLRRRVSIPMQTAGGGDTIAVRAPSHPVAQALLLAFGGPIAAPSANRSSAISPTRAEHVVAELGSRVQLVLDGGPCTVGVESTVLDLTTPRARILRPGHVTKSALADVLGEEVEIGGHDVDAGALPSPGMMRRHYAPRTKTLLADRRTIESDAPKNSVFLVRSMLAAQTVCLMPDDPDRYAQDLYDALRWADAIGAREIWIELPPQDEAWAAIHDRLARAAALK